MYKVIVTQFFSNIHEKPSKYEFKYLDFSTAYDALRKQASDCASHTFNCEGEGTKITGKLVSAKSNKVFHKFSFSSFSPKG